MKKKKIIKSILIMILLAICIIASLLLFSYLYKKYYFEKIELAYNNLMNNNNFSYICRSYNQDGEKWSEYIYLKKDDKIVVKMQVNSGGLTTMYIKDDITIYNEEKKFFTGTLDNYNTPVFYPTRDFFEINYEELKYATIVEKLKALRDCFIQNFITYTYHTKDDENNYLVMHSPYNEYYFDAETYLPIKIKQNTETYLPVKIKQNTNTMEYEVKFDCVTEEDITLPDLSEYTQLITDY